MTTTKVLIAGVSNPQKNESSISFAMGMLRAQAELLTRRDVAVNVGLYTSMHEVLNSFYKRGFDVLVAIDSLLGVNERFITRNIWCTHDLVAGVYPLPHIDWEKVKEKTQAGSAEPTALQGLDYNVSGIRGADLGSKYLTIDPPADMRAFVLKRSVLEAAVQAHPEIAFTNGAGETEYNFWTTRVVDNRRLTEAENLCALWGGPVHADYEYQLQNFGPLDFAGCVGNRQVIR